MVTPFRLLAVLLATVVALSATGQTPDEIPPEPQLPDTNALSQEEAERAYDIYEREFDEWYEELTDIQRALVDRSRMKAQRAADEARYRMPRAGDDYSWRDAAATLPLNRESRDRLGAQKILFGRTTWKQSFKAYTDATHPVFITSDSLLSAFHSLFEDSFRELEVRRIGQLRRALESTVAETRALLESSPFPASDLAPCWEHAQRVIGPALLLLGCSPECFDSATRADILAEVKRIRAADEVALPKWLAPAEPELIALDYRRCKPVGFYADTPTLADYFRAVRWLQMIPFRPARDDELGAIALLGHAARNVRDARGDPFFPGYESLIGAPADPSLNVAASLISWERTPALPAASSWRDALSVARNRLPAASEINDSLRAISSKPSLAPFRIISAAQLPDAILFQQLLDHGETVSGDYIPAALGSDWIGRQLSSRDRVYTTHAVVRLAARLDLQDDSIPASRPLYDAYLWLLASQFAPPDPDAPAFMSSDAWSAKSAQTTLAGWTQMRHSFTLQSKLAVVTLGFRELPTGFIEPNPVFFRRFSCFVAHARDTLARHGVFDPSAESAAGRLLEHAALVDAMAAEIRAGRQTGFRQNDRETPLADRYYHFIDYGTTHEALPDDIIAQIGALHFNKTKSSQDVVCLLEKISARLRAYAEKTRTAAPPPHRFDDFTSLRNRWQSLEQLAARLETLLQKQLRQRDWNIEEAQTLRNYGSSLKQIMGYFGSTPISLDDSLRWAEITRDPRQHSSFAAATGRPCALYVLYPWHGTEILCVGAVIPYYEDHSTDRLTDAEWRAKLDHAPAPDQPAWLAPYREPGPLRPPH